MSKTGRTLAPHMRWLPDEWLKVAAMAHQPITAGDNVAEAVLIAQRAVLPKHRWQSFEQLKKGSSKATAKKFVARIEAMPAEAREALLLKEIRSPGASKDEPKAAAKPPEPPREAGASAESAKPKGMKAGTKLGSIVRWTSREWALIARAAKWVSERQPELPLYDQVIEAQRWTLPPERQRMPSGIKQSHYKGAELARFLKEGLDHGWTINTVPFEPPGTREEPKGIMPELPTLRAAREAGTAVSITATTDAASIRAPAPGNLPVTPGLPLTAPAGSLQEACNAFAAHMQSGLATLLEAHTRILAAQFEAKIEGTVTALAAVLESGMRKAVHAMVAHELGDVAPPDPPQAAALGANGATPTGAVEFVDTQREAAADIDTEPPVKKLKVDIVGVPNGALASEIMSNLPGNVDARIFDPDSKSAYVPHRGRHCIMLIHRIPHSLKSKAKAAGVEPIFVKPTVFYVTHAVEELQRSMYQ